MSEPERKFVTLLCSDLPKHVLSGFVSPETSFAVHVTGPVDSKVLGRIVQFIELHREFFEEQEQQQSAANPTR